MRKFRYKITGFIAVETNSEKNYKVSEPKNFTIPKWIVEDSNDWEEVKEFPKIISFRCTDFSKKEIRIDVDNTFGNYIPFTLDQMLHVVPCVDTGHFEIYQVAISENEVFTLGDRVIQGGLECCGSLTILGFEYEPSPNDREKHTGVITVLHDHKILGKWLDLTKLYKAPEPLFVTEDKKEIYPGESYWCVNTAPHLWSLFEQTSKNWTQLNKGVLAFSTKEAAERYIDVNKPVYSKKQIREALKSREMFRKLCKY